MKTAAIIGYGRFGALLAQLARTHFAATIIESNPDRAQYMTPSRRAYVAII